ncbi:MAG TPA: response regulator [Burkholderiales bacterium]|nr:response regulator [Burkholderiales bacterium]
MAKVLVIEDEASLRANLTRILTAENYGVVTAADGDEGIRRVLEDQPDLVICDILMPGTDGFGVLAALRSRPETAAIPFIFLTASADKEDLARGLRKGANEYVTKPFKIADLLAAVKRLLPSGA